MTKETLISNLKLIEAIPRRQASVLTQLRTGHVPLAKYLYRINKCDSPTCPACLGSSGSVAHLLLHCSAFHNARQRLRINSDGIDIARIRRSFYQHSLTFLPKPKSCSKAGHLVMPQPSRQHHITQINHKFHHFDLISPLYYTWTSATYYSAYGARDPL